MELATVGLDGVCGVDFVVAGLLGGGAAGLLGGGAAGFLGGGAAGLLGAGLEAGGELLPLCPPPPNVKFISTPPF